MEPQTERARRVDLDREQVIHPAREDVVTIAPG
jgi:hypothetical protein